MTKEDLQFKFDTVAFMDHKDKDEFICILMSMATYAFSIASYMETADNGGRPVVNLTTLQGLGKTFKTKLESIK